MTFRPRHALTAALFALASLTPALRADNIFGTFDPKSDPKLLGAKVVDDLISREIPTSYLNRGGMSYPEICVAYGSLRFAAETGDKDRLAKLIKRYEFFFTEEGKPYITRPNNVDNSVFGILPMEIYRHTGIQKWLDLGKPFADAQWAPPAPGGRQGRGGGGGGQPDPDIAAKDLTWQSRFWIDDMFMITALEAEAFRVTKDKVYLDRAAREMVVYLDRLQKPNGLFFHHEQSPFYWGRGSGWMAVGMAELLSVLPEDHPNRPAILDGYKKMMAGLLKYQSKDGMWKQLLDKPDSWDETSGSGMFTFSMAMGVANGWLDESTYKDPTKKAWTALASYLTDKGLVREVCEGTNKGTSETYYETRGRKVGDFHGQAGFIWAAWAMARTPGPLPAIPTPK